MPEQWRGGPQVYLVPAKSASVECRSCGLRLYWIVTRSRARLAIDCFVPGGQPPIAEKFQDGKGVRHVCPKRSAAA